MRKPSLFLQISLGLIFAGTSHAGVVDWADWTQSDLESAVGTVAGVNVDYVGSLAFAQLANGVMVGSGASSTTDYWVEYSPAPYTGNSVVDNRPPGFELLALNLPAFNSIIFSMPVLNPVMAIVSQGQPSFTVSYDFDQPFTVLSEGRGYWGDGTYTLGAGDVLNGNELHAVIQFQGLVSEINWDSTQEFWHGFTVGVPRVDQVPEPAISTLLAMGLAAVLAARKRRK